MAAHSSSHTCCAWALITCKQLMRIYMVIFYELIAMGEHLSRVISSADVK